MRVTCLVIGERMDPRPYALNPKPFNLNPKNAHMTPSFEAFAGGDTAAASWCVVFGSSFSGVRVRKMRM